MPSAAPDEPPPARARRLGGWPLAFALVALAALAAFVFLSLKTFALPHEAAAWTERVAGKLAGLLGARVRVENSSFTLEQKEIAELALVQRRLVCITRYDASSWGSNATVIIRGVYRAKAGYDLRQGCRFTFAEGRVLAAELPPPRLLSLTTERQEVYFASEGLVQKLGPKEMEQAYAENLAQARRERPGRSCCRRRRPGSKSGWAISSPIRPAKCGSSRRSTRCRKTNSPGKTAESRWP